MSYDVYLSNGPACPTCGHYPDEVPLDWNYTCNVAPMWRKAMPETDGLAGMHDMKARDAAVVLSRGIAAMESDPEPFREMNPENGWGDFDSQLERLRQLLGWMRRYPEATVVISR